MNLLRTVYRCPFADRLACPKTTAFDDPCEAYLFSGCTVGPLTIRTGERIQTVCVLQIDPDIIQRPEDLRDILPQINLQCNAGWEDET